MSSRLIGFVFGPLPATRAEVIAAGGAFNDSERGMEARRSLLSEVRDAFRSDEELAGLLQGGDADALTVLFKRHSPLLFRIARRILRNDAEAEDAVQQIFIDIYRSIENFNPEKGEFKPWLMMFAYHRTLNRRRALLAARFFDTDPLDELLPELLRRAARSYAGPDGRILLAQILSALQPRQRRTIELTYYEGLTAEEISQRTGETVRVVRHNLYRGLERLRKSLCAPALVKTRAATEEQR